MSVSTIGNYSPSHFGSTIYQKVCKVVLAVWEAVKNIFRYIFPFLRASSLENHRIERPEQAAPVQPPNVFEGMKREVDEIVNLYEEILREPKKARSVEGDRLVDKLSRFRNQYGAEMARIRRSGAEETEPTVKAVNAIEAAERSMIYLRCLKCFFEPTVSKIGEIRVPGDGNCLYHSFLLGLELCGIAHSGNDLTLRTQANDWLRAHQDNPEVQTFLNDAIESYREARKGHLRLQRQSEAALVNHAQSLGVSEKEVAASCEAIDKIDKEIQELDALDIPGYLNLAVQDRFFGTIAEIHALSQLYRVTIKVKYIIEDREFDERPFNPGQEKKVILRYKVGGAHFDAQAFEL